MGMRSNNELELSVLRVASKGRIDILRVWLSVDYNKNQYYEVNQY